MFQTSLLTDSDIEPLADGVFAVLEEVGILCQNEELLQALEEMGAQVDSAAERVLFPRRMVADFVEGLRRENAQNKSVRPRFGAIGMPGLGTQVAQFFYDYPRRERRSGNTKDFITLIKLGDMLQSDSGVGHSLLSTDVPPLVEPIEAAMLLAEYARKPGPAFAWNVKPIDYLQEMGEILGIPNWYTLGAICIAHPLRFDRDVADRLVLIARSGSTIGLTAMPVAGASTPVTVEGFVAVSSAEHLATWMAGRAINPDVALGGSMWAGSIDIRTGHVSYSAFDAMYYAFVSVEFLRRWCGVQVRVGGGEYCDAKLPGLYAALEKAYKAMTIAAFTGEHPPVGSGMLDEGKIISPVQLLLEREITEALHHFARTVEPNKDNIGLSTIREVGLGFNSSYLETQHTLRRYRSCLWIPEFVDRSGWNGFEEETRVLDKVQEKVDALLAEYTKPDGREDQLAAMRAVADRAKRELLG